MAHTARKLSPALAVTLFAAVAVPAGVDAATVADPERYVLIVGNNHSRDSGVPALRYADDDALRYYKLFELTGAELALFTVLDDDTAELYPEMSRVARPPRGDDILATLKRWNARMAAQRRAGKAPELVFVYAGHGDRDKSGEGYVNLLDRKLYRRDLYQEVLAPSKASYVHLIIDACKSYYLVNRRGGGQADDEGDSHADEIRAFLKREELAAYPNAGVILATSGDQETHEWARYRGGILSHELRSAIAGAADVNGDGRIEYSEIHAFAAAANARVKHPSVQLRMFARPPAADRHRPLMDLREARNARLLRFDPQMAGRFQIEDDRGTRVADLNKAAGMRFDVAVDRRKAYFVRRDHKEARIAPGDGRLAVAQLSFTPNAIAARSASIDQSFRSDLYKVAFSRGFYEGFCAQAGHTPVSGKPVEFTIARADLQPVGPRHTLVAGYMASMALFDLPGIDHGFVLRYEYAVHPNLSVGAALEYARSVTDAPNGTPFELDRLAALAAASARLPLGRWITGRAELGLGYQGYFASGEMQIKRDTAAIHGSDPLGFRFEAGLGARVNLASFLFVDLRGGLGVELVTIEPDEFTHAAPYFSAGLGTAF